MTNKRAKFTQMKDGDAEDYSILAASNAKDYDHLADKSSSNKWNDNYKLKKIENSYLPEYLQLNSNQFKNWFD